MRRPSLLSPAALTVAVAALAGCVAHKLDVRYDPTEHVLAGHDLGGLRVAVRRVRDMRRDDQLGVHRDGLARVTQYPYVPAAPLERSVRATFEATLNEAHATIVPAGSAAGEPPVVTFDIDIVHVDMTTDGPLAGEETFGELAFRVAIYDAAGKRIADDVYHHPFANEDRADPDMLGDAVHKLCGTIVRSIVVPRARTGTLVHAPAPAPAPSPAPADDL